MSASPGTAGRRISSTPASRRRSADASVGGTVDDVSAGVRSAGIDWTTAIRASARRLQRQQPVVVADEGDRTSGQLGGECLMVAAPDDVERRLIEPSQPAAQLVQPARRRRIVVAIDQAPPLRLREALHQSLQRRLVGRPEQHVLAGAQRGDGIDDLRRSLGQGAHVQGIGDGHAVELQLLAQQVAQDRGDRLVGRSSSGRAARSGRS